MTEYKDKKELMDEISNRAKLFIDEFSHIKEDDKDKLIDGVDRTPAQMVAYQLGWLNLLLYWEDEEQQGNTVITRILIINGTILADYMRAFTGNMRNTVCRNYAPCFRKRYKRS